MVLQGDVSYLALVKVHGCATQWVGCTELSMLGAPPQLRGHGHGQPHQCVPELTEGTGEGRGGLQTELSSLGETDPTRWLSVPHFLKTGRDFQPTMNHCLLDGPKNQSVFSFRWQ